MKYCVFRVHLILVFLFVFFQTFFSYSEHQDMEAVDKYGIKPQFIKNVSV